MEQRLLLADRYEALLLAGQRPTVRPEELAYDTSGRRDPGASSNRRSSGEPALAHQPSRPHVIGACIAEFGSWIIKGAGRAGANARPAGGTSGARPRPGNR
jgi:hypothetical protein